MSAIKLERNLGAITFAEDNVQAITRGFTNLGVSLLPAVAAKYGIPVVGEFLAAMSLLVGSANLGPFVASLFLVERYSKFIIIPSNGPPVTPTLNKPNNNETQVSIPVTVYWNSSIHAVSYELQVSRSQDFAEILFGQAVINVNSIQVTTLQNGIKYYWRVRAKNSYGTSNWSEVWSFTTAADNRTPNLPSSPNPSDGASGVRTAITLSWSCSDPDGDPITYDVFWGTTEATLSQIGTDLTSPSTSRGSLTQGATYFWRIVAKDNHGNMTLGPTWRFTIGTVPTCDFTWSPTIIYTSTTVQFTDQSSDNATYWEWTFGDGTSSNLQNPTHRFTVAGRYTVGHTAGNTFGWCADVAEIIVNQSVIAPIAAFTGTPTMINVGQSVQFNDQSTNNPTSWSWNFGDGNTSTSRNPSHTYTNAGTYTVSLTATNSAGSDSETKNGYITVNAVVVAPVAAFIGSPTTITAGQSVQFTDQSTNTPTSWSWNFGDGGTSTTRNPSHVYNTAGTFTVTLTATNSAGSDGETKNGYIIVSDRCTPTLISPAHNAELDNSCYSAGSGISDNISWFFDWSDCEGETLYNLYVIGQNATIPIINVEITNSEYSSIQSDSYIVDANRFGRIWRVRAFVNGEWGEWSNERTFDVEPLNTDCSTATITDIDGNVYNTVTIGTQVWMKENLKTTKYNDGTSIPTVPYDEIVWNNLSTPAYCLYTIGGSTYGPFYNWFTVNTSKLCPTGWHVPSDTELSTLTTYLGGEAIAGGKLKESGTTHWKSPNTGATNETGFTALPNEYFYGEEGIWWSSTQADNINTFAMYRGMKYNSQSVLRQYNPKQKGFVVRCLKD